METSLLFFIYNGKLGNKKTSLWYTFICMPLFALELGVCEAGINVSFKHI